MKEITTAKGHKVLELNINEVMTFSHVPTVCDFCNGGLLGKSYFIGSLNSVYCDDCYENWVKRVVYYKEDANIENARIDSIKYIIKRSSL